MNLTHRRYIGDGVYVGISISGGDIVLTTEDGISVTSRIVLEPEVLQAFLAWFNEQTERWQREQNERQAKEAAQKVSAILDGDVERCPVCGESSAQGLNTVFCSQRCDDLGPPEDLDDQGRAAWKLIANFALEHELTPNGCRTFYSPAEWRERGEKYLQKALLVIVYDGSALKRAIALGPETDAELYQALKAKLAEAGFYLEEGEHWNAGVYVR